MIGLNGSKRLPWGRIEREIRDDQLLNHYDPYLVAADLKRDKWVFVIGIGKLIKGLLLFAAGVGALKLLGKDLASELSRWIERLNVDPHNQYFVSVLSKVKGLDGRKIVLVTIGTFVYASLFLTEAIGLLRDVRRRPTAHSYISLSGADPLNLVGILTPGPRLPSLSGNRVLYRDGVPLAVFAGGEVRFLEKLQGKEQWDAQNLLLRRHVPAALADLA